MAIHNRDVIKHAKQRLKGNLWQVIAVILIYYCIQFFFLSFDRFAKTTGMITGLLIFIIILGPFSIGYYKCFLSLVQRKQLRVLDVFSGFRQFGKGLSALLLTFIFAVLWSLLLIVPGIIAALSYIMTFFILADNPDISAIEAIRKSKIMMEGYKWKLVCMQARFIPRCLVIFFAMIGLMIYNFVLLFHQGKTRPESFTVSPVVMVGDYALILISLVWILPLYHASLASFYQDIKERAEPLSSMPEANLNQNSGII